MVAYQDRLCGRWPRRSGGTRSKSYRQHPAGLRSSTFQFDVATANSAAPGRRLHRATPRDPAMSDDLDAQNLDGTNYRSALGETSLRRVGRSAAISETVAANGRAWEAARPTGLMKPEPTQRMHVFYLGAASTLIAPCQAP